MVASCHCNDGLVSKVGLGHLALTNAVDQFQRADGGNQLNVLSGPRSDMALNFRMDSVELLNQVCA